MHNHAFAIFLKVLSESLRLNYGISVLLFSNSFLLQVMDGMGGGRRRIAAKSSAEDQALDQIAKEVS